MNFNPNDPIDQRVLVKARAFMNALPRCADGDFDRGYFHWAVSTYSQTFPEYTAMVWFDGSTWNLKMTHDPRDNALSTFDPGGYAGHTYRRNGGAFGVSIAGMLAATSENFGPYPVTRAGVEHLCAAMAALCRRYGVQCNGHAPGKFYSEAVEHTVMTHAEAARWTPSTSNGVDYPHYYTFEPGGDPDSRWDLNLLQPRTDRRPTMADAYVTASLLRQRAHVIGAHL